MATNDHPNAALVRTALDAFATGDMQAVDQYIADDIVWHQIGGATAHGKEELARAMSGGADTDWDISVELHDVVANDEHAVAMVSATATRGGKTLSYRTAEIVHVRDGKVTERWAFSDDTQRIIEFFS
jgi:uncharacterized protein